MMSVDAPWLLLRGLMRESRHWEAFPQLMQAQWGTPPWLVDLPGNGRLYRQASPTTIAGMVECLRAQLKRDQPPLAFPINLLALSLGAMIALEWQRRYPSEISRLVLINTSLRGLNPFYQRLRPSAYPLLLKQILIPSSPVQLEYRILQRTSNLCPDLARVAHQRAAYWRECPTSRSNLLRQLLAAARYRLPASPPDCPTLILAACADCLVSPQCSRQLAHHWQLPIALHPTAGHDLPLDDGPWVIAQILQWLRLTHPA